MGSGVAQRHARQHGSREDQRTPAEKDRDRILYTSSFRRLAGVTQVVGPSDGHLLHNRLTHSLEVAQIARRLAQRLCQQQKDLSKKLELDPDVAEAAALAHDLGHPPFGHVAEVALDSLADNQGGFEGNAQSFRIVTRLAVCGGLDPEEGQRGLDLTRATLNAVIKYPWARGGGPPGKEKKWGYYEDDKEQFTWARLGVKDAGAPTLEAHVMTFADDIAYSVHDTEDFYRAGLIPLDRLIADNPGVGERGRFLDAASVELKGKYKKTELETIFRRFCGKLAIDSPYTGTLTDRVRLRRTTSALIGEYLLSVNIVDDGENGKLAMSKNYEDEIELAKQLTRYYVINAPALATQQWGQVEIIETLFETYDEALKATPPELRIIPATFRDQATAWSRGDRGEGDRVRLVVDIIASMTDYQALCMYQRVTGQAPGTVFDPSFR